MKQIFINGRYLTQRMTGVQRYATEVVRALDILLESSVDRNLIKVIVLAPQGSFELPALRQIEVRQGGWFQGHLWEQIDLPRMAREGLLFNPCGPSPLLHSKQITMLPDASIFVAPQGYSLAYRTWMRFLYRATGMRAREVFTISEYSKKRLLEHCGTLRDDKIKVIYPGVDHTLGQQPDVGILKRIFPEGMKDYVLCVGSQQANKNIGIVASISGWLYERGIRTVITGGTDQSVFRDREIETEHVVKTGYVSDSELRALYENARCFIFPSFEEGFGIPPLEAMRCGCPVVSSSTASMPEVCGDAALFFDPYIRTELEEVLDKVLHEPGVIEQLKLKGKDRVAKYRWKNTASDVWQHLLIHSTGDAGV